MVVCFVYWWGYLDGDGLNGKEPVRWILIKISYFFLLLFVSIGAVFAFVRDDIVFLVYSSVFTMLISIGVLFGIKYWYLSSIIVTVLWFLLYFVDKNIIRMYFLREMEKVMGGMLIRNPKMAFFAIQTFAITMSFGMD
jgi:hypothetical protein